MRVDAPIRPEVHRNQLVEPPVAPLDIGLLFDLAPRKLGSIEDWICGIATAATGRGHTVSLYCRAPVHHVVRERLEGVGVRIEGVERLLSRPLEAVRSWSRHDVLQLNFFGPTTKAALCAYAARKARIVYVDHTSGTTSRAAGVRAAAGRQLRRMVGARLHTVVGVSEFVRRRDEQNYLLPSHKTRTIYNGVDLSRFQPDWLRVRSGPIRIRATAYLIPAKGIDVLIRAFARLEGDVRLDVIGDGPERANLEKLATELGVGDRVEFLGLRDDVDQLLLDADIFVHPARWAEAFGLTIAEAMAARLPVVATDIGGIPEIIEDGVTGMLFPAGDDVRLAERLQGLITSPERREKLGGAARDRVSKLFDLSKNVTAHVRTLEEAGLHGRDAGPLF